MLDQALPVASEGPTGTDHDQRSAMPTTLPPASRQGRAGRSGWLTFVWALVAFGLMIGAWSLATPLFAAPDEPSHVIQAAAAVRGEFDVPAQPGTYGAMSKVKVPEWAGEAGTLPDCFAFKSSVPAGCELPLGDQRVTVLVETQFSNYPPLYYLVVGVPSLIWSGSGAVYAMRLVSLILCSGLIALGLFLLGRYHPRRLPLAGAALALTPMVLFLSAVVNSSGMEITAAFAAWCGGLCILEQDEVPAALALWTAVAFVVLILSRPISPANAAIIVVVLVALGGLKRARSVLHDRRFRLVWVPALLATAVAGVLLVIGGSPGLLHASVDAHLDLIRSAWVTLQLVPTDLRQMVGRFGWLDTPVPYVIYISWWSMVGGLCAVAVVVSRKCRRALPLLVVLAAATLVAFQAPKIDTVGIYWQARYSLPLAVGLPLVASTLQARRGSHGSPSRPGPLITVAGILVVGSAVIAAQVAAFIAALHRYQTGVGAAVGAPVRWKPPGGTSLVIALLVSGLALALGLFVWVALAPGRRLETPEPLEPPGTDRSEVADHLPVREVPSVTLEPTG
jgi:hypothetical protein